MQLLEERKGLAFEPSVWFFAGQVDATRHAERIPIYGTPFRIGRLTNLPLTLPCECVSKEHAEVIERDGNMYLRDLGSTNGTYVNGQRVVDEALLTQGDIVQFATAVFRVGKEESCKASATAQELAGDRAFRAVQVQRLIREGAVVPFYQPVVELDSARRMIGYEVLGRRHLFGLRTPGEMFSAASQLDLQSELSRVLRRRSLHVARQLASDLVIFANTHPAELVEDHLIDSFYELREAHTSRIIALEIHEATITTRDAMKELRRALTDLDMRLAFDDFGAGQDRLLELCELNPDYVKFDIGMIRGLHHAPASRQQVVEALAQMVNDIGCSPVAEGVEDKETHQTLCQMSFKLGQGFLYAEPTSISKCTSQSMS